jgi:two-component system, OmpR family, response regulator
MAEAHDLYRDSGEYSEAAEPRMLRCGDLVLDESRWTVHRAGTLVDLSPTEFRLLACLMRHQGSVLSRTQLLQHVWGGGYTGQAQVVETYVSYLRRKLHRLGPPLIHTRRGVGYTLRCPDPGRPDSTSPDLTSPDVPGRLDPLDDRGVGLAAALAHGLQAEPP